MWNLRLGGASEPLSTRKITIKYTILYSRFVVDHSLEEEKEREKTLPFKLITALTATAISASGA